MRTVHVRCGDDLNETLPAAGFTGDVLTYSDPVSQGPVPAEPDEEAFAAVRADWLADALGLDRAETLSRLRAERAALDRLDDYDRILLWFEHDWFDQAILIRLLSKLAARPAPHSRLFLMSIDHVPGQPSGPAAPRFIGFGQLTPEQLSMLVGHERPITPAMFALAGAAWAALRAPDPTGLLWVEDQSLPYLPAAIQRHLRELPWTTDGLGLSERLCLQAVASGPLTFPALFHAHQQADPLPGIGDALLAPVLRGLAHADRPALERVDDLWRLTPYGMGLLSDKDRWSTAPRWVGGVRLPGWQWEPRSGQVVAA
jgi:hypothetical protein